MVDDLREQDIRARIQNITFEQCIEEYASICAVEFAKTAAHGLPITYSETAGIIARHFFPEEHHDAAVLKVVTALCESYRLYSFVPWYDMDIKHAQGIIKLKNGDVYEIDYDDEKYLPDIDPIDIASISTGFFIQMESGEIITMKEAWKLKEFLYRHFHPRYTSRKT